MSQGVRSRIFRAGALFMMMAVALVIFLPALVCPRERAPRISCANNLKQIGLGIKMYAGDHGKAFPAMLVDTRRYLADQPRLFICPQSGNRPGPIETVDEWTDYVYLSGLTSTSAQDKVIVFCSSKNHDWDGGNILFRDGHVEWFNSDGKTRGEPSFEDMIRAIRQQRKQ